MFHKIMIKNPFQLFLTILLPFLISTLLILFVQSSFLTRNLESFALEKIYTLQKTVLQNTIRNLKVMEQSARSLAITTFFDSLIKDLLYMDIEFVDYPRYVSKLESYKNIYPFLQSIYIYSGDNIRAVPSKGFNYNRSTFDDQGIFLILDDIKNNNSHSIVLRKIPNILYEISSQEEFIHVYSYLFFDSQVQSGKVSNAIILNISENALNNSITSAASNGNNRMFLIDQYNRLMSEDSKHELLSDLSNNNYIEKITESNDKSGSFRMDVNGVDSFIAYESAGVFNWKLISITPYEDIMREIHEMRKNTLLPILLFILGNVILTFYFSRRLYIPIKLVIQNYKMLESEKKNEFYYRKQNFLRKLVYSKESKSIELLHKQFSKYNIELTLTDSYLLVLYKLDHHTAFNEAYSFTDRKLLIFGIANIISEGLSALYKLECIEVETEQILVLLRYTSEDQPSNNAGLVELVSEVQTNIRKFMHISTSVSFSEPFNTLYNLNFQYLKTLDLSYYRLILGHGALLFHENIQVNMDEYKYPQQLDKELVDNLIQGQQAEAFKAFNGIVESASEYSYTIINSMLIRMLLSIRQAIEVLEATHAVRFNFNFNVYLAKLQEFETLDQIRSEFQSLFTSLAQELESMKNNKYIQLIEDITRIINEEFADPTLSLDMIAEKVNLSPAYIGKLYKKHCMISITDMINNVRMNYVREQISFTDESINLIMNKSGYVSRSHFFTQFKKTYGVTPSQYRSNSKRKELNK